MNVRLPFPIERPDRRVSRRFEIAQPAPCRCEWPGCYSNRHRGIKRRAVAAWHIDDGEPIEVCTAHDLAFFAMMMLPQGATL